MHSDAVWGSSVASNDSSSPGKTRGAGNVDGMCSLNDFGLAFLPGARICVASKSC